MNKPHYTCAIKALYMMDTFGVQFKNEFGNEVKRRGLQEFIYRYLADYEPPYFIHPDSLHIFEPQDGDVCELAGDDQYYSSISGDYAEVYMSYVGYDNPVAISLNALAELRDGKAQIAKIIQRNNKPFFMYEV